MLYIQPLRAFRRAGLVGKREEFRREMRFVINDPQYGFVISDVGLRRLGGCPEARGVDFRSLGEVVRRMKQQ